MSYGYDELNRLSTVTEPGNAPVTYNYDANGNLGGYVYPNGVSTSYSYDALNRLSSETRDASVKKHLIWGDGEMQGSGRPWPTHRDMVAERVAEFWSQRHCRTTDMTVTL